MPPTRGIPQPQPGDPGQYSVLDYTGIVTRAYLKRTAPRYIVLPLKLRLFFLSERFCSRSNKPRGLFPKSLPPSFTPACRWTNMRCTRFYNGETNTRPLDRNSMARAQH